MPEDGHRAKTAQGPQAGTASEVLAVFLRLGLTSFGGPIAHLGYFRDELVTRRKWLSDVAYADLVALCQFLPGPASSQVGLALGLMRAGWAGALAAWAAFTLPSVALLLAFAAGASALDGPLAAGALSGLKLVAVAIVAQAVWGMARTLCPDGPRAGIAVLAVALVVAVPGGLGQIAAILAGAALGLALGLAPGGAGSPPDGPLALAVPVSRRLGLALIGVFGALLLLLPLAADLSPALGLVDAVYRAGALVFGGGHVVLPLLEAGMVQTGRVEADAFLAGYGAAQAVPGPLFTFAAYLGAIQTVGPSGLAGAALALAAIFAPGFLLLLGVLPFWAALRLRPGLQALMRGTNAAVVGILGAALHDPVFSGAVETGPHFALALACFVALTVWKVPAWAVVLIGAGVGVLLELA